VKAKLRLSERTYRCDECGLCMDRDRNAARNLAALAAGLGGASSPSCGATINEPAGNPCKTSLAGSGYRHGKPPAGNVA
jgi:putative transposase